jgi:uncharacterized membrane protein YecN with MAPEG domain
MVDTGIEYYHNILLEILVGFGFVVFAGFILFVGRSFVKMARSGNGTLKWVYCILFVLCFGRLMFSSTFWQRPEFWLFIGFYIANGKYFIQNENTVFNG